MAAAGARKNYAFGAKSHWRRTIWNEVLRRTAGRERDQPILYLAGPDDIDRKVAIQKGVPAHNLIAIDRDNDNVRAVRRSGGVAIAADIVDVLWAWPKDRPVAAVLLDFCCGLNYDTIGSYDAFQHQPLQNAVAMMNFMRGRDAYSNGMRDCLRQAGLLNKLWREDPRTGEPVCTFDDPNHRAFQFSMYHALDKWNVLRGYGSGGTHQLGDGRKQQSLYQFIPPGDAGHDEWTALISLLFSQPRPSFYSYKSGVLTFDSVVMDRLFGGAAPASVMARVVSAVMAAGLPTVDDLLGRFRDSAVARKVSAAMAVRTMRANA